MTEFADKSGTKWIVEIDTGLIKDVRSRLGVDLLDIQGGIFNAVLVDVCTLVDVLYVACEEQATRQQIDEVAFARRLGSGDVIQAATDALMEAIIDFFPPRRRDQLRAALKKIHDLETATLERAMTILEGDEIDNLVKEQFEQSQKDLLQTFGP